MVNGTNPLDTQGNPTQLHNGSIWFEPDYNLWFAVTCVATSASNSLLGVITVVGYASPDCLNWSLQGTAYTNVVNGNTYGEYQLTHTIRNPTDGLWYNVIQGTTGGVTQAVVQNSTTPWGPFSYVGTLPIASTDNNLYLDPFGNVMLHGGLGLYNLTSNLSVTGSTLGSFSTGEGFTPHYANRGVYCYQSLLTGWNPNADYCTAYVVPSTLTGLSSYATIPNTTIYTTVAESVVAPGGAVYGFGTALAGTVNVVHTNSTITFSVSQSGLIGSVIRMVGDSTYSPYLVTAGSGTSWTIANTCSDPEAAPYAGSTANGLTCLLLSTGVDPICSYGTQTCDILTTNSSPPQYILLAERYQNPSGYYFGNLPSPPVWLPITYDTTTGIPTIPFVSSFTPRVLPPAGSAAGGAALLMHI